jgi:predicted restriction endonuclease
LKEFRLLGKAEFMRRFGFRTPSKTWFIDAPGEPKPDLKMIAARARQLSRPSEKPLKTRDFQTRDARAIIGTILKYRLIGPQAADENKIQDTLRKIGSRKIKSGLRKEYRNVTVRQGAGAFRNNLLQVYTKCAVTGWRGQAALDAAHIIPVSQGGLNDVNNGLFLRADIHNLFDLHLVRIDFADLTISIDQSLRGTPYFRFHRQKLKLPKNEAHHPSPALLRKRSKMASVVM